MQNPHSPGKEHEKASPAKSRSPLLTHWLIPRLGVPATSDARDFIANPKAIPLSSVRWHPKGSLEV